MRLKICIVSSIYNNEITNKIRISAIKELNKLGINKVKNIEVPGAFEIPLAVSKLVNQFDGFIAIGCVIKGDTANFDLITQAITNGIMQISIDKKKPIGNAILTCFNKNQAKKRINRGAEAAKAVIAVLKNDSKKN
tara:strand:- start:162 stop:569 length:408 start_codon:yes stop_codon:yes gene_type:complete